MPICGLWGELMGGRGGHGLTREEESYWVCHNLPGSHDPDNEQDMFKI